MQCSLGWPGTHSRASRSTPEVTSVPHWHVDVSTPLRLCVQRVYWHRSTELQNSRTCNSPWDLTHLQSCLLLGRNMLLLSMVPEVLVKRGSGEGDAKMEILVTWLLNKRYPHLKKKKKSIQGILDWNIFIIVNWILKLRCSYYLKIVHIYGYSVLVLVYIKN